MKFGTVVDKARLPEANKQNKARNQHNRTNNEGHQVKRRRIKKYLRPQEVTTPQEPQEVTTPQEPQEVMTPQEPQEVMTLQEPK